MAYSGLLINSVQVCCQAPPELSSFDRNLFVLFTVKPVLNGRLKIDKTKVLMENGSLMKVKVLQNAPVGAFCNTFDLH